jgi:hypothetical protein
VRHGNVFGGTRFKHDFKGESSWVWIIKKKTPVTLYRLGRFYRLELPSGCKVNWRGFVTP